MGLLTQTVSLSTANVDLTATGRIDWAAWDGSVVSLTPTDWKNGGGRTIPPPTMLGVSPGLYAVGGDVRTFSWTDGTNVAISSSNGEIFPYSSTDNGLQFVLPADTALRTAYVYITGYWLNPTAATITSSLSDSSAPPQTDNTTFVTAVNDTADALIELQYQANSAGQSLTLQFYIPTNSNSPNVTLQAVAIASVGVPYVAGTVRRAGPGIGPFSNTQFAQRPLAILPVVPSASGAGAIAESSDAAAGSGSTATAAAGAISEAHDAASGIGVASTAGSGSIAEPHDTVSGAGVAGAGGSGAIVEGADQVAGAGSASTSGSGAIGESHDTVSGVGSVSTSGSGAIAEGADIAAGAGVAGAPGSGAAVEAPDTVSGSGSASISGSGAIGEAHDTVDAVGVASDSGAGAINESDDAVTGDGDTSASTAIVILGQSFIVSRPGAFSATRH